jgi:hypothetical protein
MPIAHYVAEHHYVPPVACVDAALHGPYAADVAQMTSSAGHQAHGGRRRWWQR